MSADTAAAFRDFRLPGPVSAAFAHDNTSRVKALLGPVGGGKTVTCIYDSIRSASMMTPCNDGVIRYVRAIVGSTYGQIERNLYPSWNRYLPRDKGWTEGEWSGGGGRFATHRLHWKVLRGNRVVDVDAEYIFAAIGDLVVEEFMRGFQPTDLWGFELDQLPEAFINVGLTRIGRFPATGDRQDEVKRDVGFECRIIGDLNAPDVDSWFYRKFEEEKPDGFKLYRQPSGMSPDAENRGNLRKGYYEDQVKVLSGQANGRNLVKRMVHAQYGPSQAGEPVYPEWNDDLHFSPESLRFLPDRPVLVGFDQDLHPAAIVCQQSSTGQWRILREVVPGRAGPRKFAGLVRQCLAELAPGLEIESAWCDPAGFHGADREDGDLAWAEIVAAELGVPILPAPSNEIDLRLTAVRDELVFMIDGRDPGIVVDPSCRQLRKGMVSHYMYESRPQEKSQQRKPVKNPWANPQDALQYVLLGAKGRYGVIEGRRPPGAPERVRRRAEPASCVMRVEMPEF